MPFPKEFGPSETQKALTMIWTWVVHSISNANNRYTKRVSDAGRTLQK